MSSKADFVVSAVAGDAEQENSIAISQPAAALLQLRLPLALGIVRCPMRGGVGIAPGSMTPAQVISM
jgi:hypothetical protein